MSDLIVALGLVLVVEGLVWALAPHIALKVLAMAAATPPVQLRAAGWMAVAAGVWVVWLIRG